MESSDRLGTADPTGDFTIIIPTYNEAANVGSLIDDIRRHAKNAPILVVDDASSDATADVVRRVAVHDVRTRVLEQKGPRLGLGGSVLHGIRETRTRWFIVMDGDHQHPPDLLPRLFERLRAGYDVVVATRRGISGLEGGRTLLSIGANVLSRADLALTRQRSVRDPMSGFFGGATDRFRGTAERGGRFDTTGYKILYHFLRLLPPDCRIAEVAFTLQTRKKGESKLDYTQVLHVLRQAGPFGRFMAALVNPFFSLRFSRFAIVGGTGILVNMGLLALLAEFAGLHYLLSALIAVEASILWNFAWNERWTWRDRLEGSLRIRILKFHQVSAVGLFINIVTLYVLTGQLGLHYLSSNGFAIVLAAAWNYLANHRWTWGMGRTRDYLTTSPANRRTWYAVAFLIQIALAAMFVHDWDGYVLEQSVRTFLTEGVSPYEVALQRPPDIYLGFSTPPTNMWYAYPPLPLLLLSLGYGPYLLLGVGSPMLARMAWKAPIIVGNLLVAWTVAGYLRARKVPRTTVASTEAFLLWNPFLIAIGAVWGMFDVWIMIFLVASLWAVERNRAWSAGALFALSILVKPFPLFLLPPLLAYLRPRRQIGRFLGGMAATTTALVLPFIPVWRGLLEQVVGIHLGRPPQGFAIAGLLPAIEAVSTLSGIFLDAEVIRVANDMASLASFAVLSLGLIVAYLSMRFLTSERNPVLGMALSLFVVLLASKVVNEQYFVMPLIVLALLAHEGSSIVMGATAAWRAARWLTFAGTAVVFLRGFHFILFVPADIALPLWGTDTDSVVAGLAQPSGIPKDVFYALPSVISSVLLLPFFATMAVACLRALSRGVAGLTGQARNAWALRDLTVRRGAIVGIVAIMLILPIVASETVHPAVDSASPESSETPQGGPLVGVFYYAWWRNPSRNPVLRYAGWSLTTATPIEGYYDINARYIELDLLEMKSAGIDFVVVSFDGGDLDRLLAIVDLAGRIGLHVTILWELGELHEDPRNQPITPEGEPAGEGAGLALREDSLSRTATWLSHFPKRLLESPAWLRIEDRPAIFLYNTHVSSPGFSDRDREFLIRSVFRMASQQEVRAHLGRTDVNQSDLVGLYPDSIDGFLAPTTMGDFWRWAYLLAYEEFWNRILALTEADLGQISWLGSQSWYEYWPFYRGVEVAVAARDVFETTFVYTPATALSFRGMESGNPNWEDWQGVLTTMARAEREHGHLVTTTVMPAYNDLLARSNGFQISADGGATYSRTWEMAIAEVPDIILITTWNEHFEGTGIEPTLEHGDLFLSLTALRTSEAAVHW